jgi:DNA-binding response OmpR family regulator
MARIVIIEDDESMRAMLTAMTEWMGHEVYAEDNGNTGLRRVRDCLPDLVITDMVMPEKEGVETIMELRRNYPKIKVIAMSGGGRNSSSDYLVLAKKLGAHYVLTKPFSRDELKIALESVLARGNALKEAA